MKPKKITRKQAAYMMPCTLIEQVKSRARQEQRAAGRLVAPAHIVVKAVTQYLAQAAS